MNFLQRDNRGVTLVELVIYIAVSSILLVEISGILSQIVYNQQKVQGITREDEAARTIMRIMSQSVEEAHAINSPDSVNASSSTLNLTDVNNNTIIYSLSNGIIKKQVNSNTAVAISPNDIYVKALTFTVESEAGVAPSINIQINEQQTSTNATNAAHYETTAAQREIE